MGVTPAQVMAARVTGVVVEATRSGTVEAIWIKRAHRGVMDPVLHARFVAGQGLDGNADRSRRRQVSLLTREAWDACMEALGAAVDPSARRANLLVRGVDLARTRGRVLRVGEVRVRVGGELTPCERMEEAWPGLQDVMRPEWRGGAFGEVLDDGVVRVGDVVAWEREPAAARRTGRGSPGVPRPAEEER